MFGAGLALTSGSLGLLHALVPGPGHGAEVAVLTAANLLVTATRFVVLRVWVFRSPTVRPATPG